MTNSTKKCRHLLSVLTLVLLPWMAGSAAALGIPAGSQAPAWVLSDAEGNPFNFPEDTQGKPAILFFWATWCPYCKALMPWLNQLQGEFEDDGVQLLTLSIREDGDPVAYLAEKNYDFSLFLEADDVAAEFAVRFTPGLFVVDGNGIVLYNRYDDLATPEVPNEDQASHQQKASVRVPHWAEQVQFHLRKALGKFD